VLASWWKSRRGLKSVGQHLLEHKGSRGKRAYGLDSSGSDPLQARARDPPGGMAFSKHYSHIGTGSCNPPRGLKPHLRGLRPAHGRLCGQDLTRLFNGSSPGYARSKKFKRLLDRTPPPAPGPDQSCIRIRSRQRPGTACLRDPHPNSTRSSDRAIIDALYRRARPGCLTGGARHHPASEAGESRPGG
jgi:hypothetical protein